MTPERLAELEALCAAATDGPWTIIEQEPCAAINADHWDIFSPDPREPVVGEGIGCLVANEEDARLMAEVRTALPESLAEVRRLQAAVKRADVQIAALMEDR